MQWLANLSVRRSVFAAVIMLVIFVIGLAAYRSLGVDFFPNIDFPIVAVITRLAGAAPTEVETDITDPLEAAINTVSGIEELRSVSTEGVSQVYVWFTLDKDVNVAAQEVRDKISTAMPNLPLGIEPPVVLKVDPSASRSGKSPRSPTSRSAANLKTSRASDRLPSSAAVSARSTSWWTPGRSGVWASPPRMCSGPSPPRTSPLPGEASRPGPAN